MFKKCLSLVLVLLLALGTFTACGSDSADSDKKGASASEDTDNAKNTLESEESVIVADVETIATELANAVMVYDLATIKKYSILDAEDCEQILTRVIGELLNEDGEYEWDGVYCGPSYDDFIKVYDEHMYREYDKLQITLTDTKLYDDTDILSEADKRELYNREETGISAYEKAVADIEIDKVAVSTFNITFKDKTTNDPMTGEPVEYEEINVTMTIYLVLTEGEWKSYSPTIAGAFPPLTHFPRYTVEV